MITVDYLPADKLQHQGSYINALMFVKVTKTTADYADI